MSDYHPTPPHTSPQIPPQTPSQSSQLPQSPQKKSLGERLWQGLKYFWYGLDFTRRFVINMIFLAIILYIFIGISLSGKEGMKDKTTLVLSIKGDLVEQHALTASEAMVAQMQGQDVGSTQLRDVLRALELAKDDEHIDSLYVNLDPMGNAGIAMLRDVVKGIENFKAKGKKVYAWGSSFDQKRYFIAAHADKVYMHPMGMVLITGFGHYQNYYKDALDKVGVTINVMKVGTYKNFAEPFIANEPSQASLEASSLVLNDLWKQYTDTVEDARGLEQGSIVKSIENITQDLKEVKGDTGKLALKSKLVDELKTSDEMREMMIGLGAKDDENHTFRQISMTHYLAQKIDFPIGDQVAVVVAEGEIADGSRPPGSIGGTSTAKLIRDAREDKNVKALVLRVNSPGGSAFASELIRRELELTKKAGKPVVISMGNVAASGGYWISMSSDEVMADPSTITGSIGVFAIFPTVEKVTDKLGVHTGGTTTTWLSDATNPMRPLDPRAGELIQLSVENIYTQFTERAAAARKTTPEKIDAVAQGRIWTGVQAKERGLIDSLGGLQDAIDSAAKRAKLSHYRVHYVEFEPSQLDKIIASLSKDMIKAAANEVTQQFKVSVAPSGVPAKAAAQMVKDLVWLGDLQQSPARFTVLAHCMCELN